MPHPRRSVLLVIALLVLVVVAGVSLRRPASTEHAGSRDPSSTAVSVHAEQGPPQGARSSAATRGAAMQAKLDAARSQRAKRDELRARIVDALSDRAIEDESEDPPSRQAARDESTPEPGRMRDRIGGRESLAAHLNADFMPLVDECIELAHEQLPALEGLLALGIETVADEELGAIVEAVDLQPGNEIQDRALIECIQESALSMVLPPPTVGGREQLMLTIPVEPATP